MSLVLHITEQASLSGLLRCFLKFFLNILTSLLIRCEVNALCQYYQVIMAVLPLPTMGFDKTHFLTPPKLNFVDS